MTWISSGGGSTAGNSPVGRLFTEEEVREKTRQGRICWSGLHSALGQMVEQGFTTYAIKQGPANLYRILEQRRSAMCNFV